MAPCDAQARIRELEAQVRQLREALTNTLCRWVTLVESGDAGNWDPEKEPHVIAARAALAASPAPVEIVDAQHDETGRMWQGPKDQVPIRYNIVVPVESAARAQPQGEQKEHRTCNSYPLCRCGFKPGSLTFVCEYLAEQESGNG